jgi:hypothetical protein
MHSQDSRVPFHAGARLKREAQRRNCGFSSRVSLPLGLRQGDPLDALPPWENECKRLAAFQHIGPQGGGVNP